ncbi:MAG: hypothetical protein ACXIUL_10900 [Wenzhouxiangella sp.]
MQKHRSNTSFPLMPVAAAVFFWLAASSVSAALWHGATSEQTERRLNWYQGHIEASGLKPLSEVELPRGQEEIRILYSGSKYSQGQLLRLVQRNGHIEGEVILFRRAFQQQSIQEPLNQRFLNQRQQLSIAETCLDIREKDGLQSCRGNFAYPPDWQLLYRQLWLDQLWSLPDQAVACERDPRWISTGGRTMLVELRRGDRYRAYSYFDPFFSFDCDSESQAWIIAGRFQDLLTQLPPVLRVLRLQGVVDHPDSTTFWPCDSNRPLIFEPSLAELDLPGIENPGNHAFELELSALEASEAMVLERGFEASQGLLLLPQIQWIRPAAGPGRACSGAEN